MTQPATVGSQLLYTYEAIDGVKKTALGQSRPATVVRDWGGCYNVQVLTDGVNDFDDKRATFHKTSVQLCACIAKGRLHWAGSPVESEPEAPAADPEPEAPVEPTADLAANAEHNEQIQTTIAPPTVLKKKPAGSKKSKPAGK